MTKAQRTERNIRIIIILLTSILVLMFINTFFVLHGKKKMKKQWYKCGGSAYIDKIDKEGYKTDPWGLRDSLQGSFVGSPEMAVRNATYFLGGAEYRLREGSYFEYSGEGFTEIDQVDVVQISPIGNQGDYAVWLTHQIGGTGVFWHVAIASPGQNSYIGSNAVLIGDRIMPGTIELQEDNVVVNYLERAFGEPLTAEPSIAQQKIILRDVFER